MYCTCCGLCCSRLGDVELPDEYKYLDDGTGKCRFLSDNLCSIYEKRPLVCNHEKMYELYLKDKFASIDEYEQLLKVFCKEIQKRNNMDER